MLPVLLDATPLVPGTDPDAEARLQESGPGTGAGRREPSAGSDGALVTRRLCALMVLEGSWAP